MRIVIDTNILISALISPDNLPNRLYQLWLNKKFDLVTSEWQIAEIRRVSRYDGIRDYFPTHQAGRMINGLRIKALVLDGLPEVVVHQAAGTSLA